MRNSNQDSNINLKSTLKHIAKAWLHCIHQDKWMSGILLDIMNALATTKLKIKGLGFRFGREYVTPSHILPQLLTDFALSKSHIRQLWRHSRFAVNLKYYSDKTLQNNKMTHSWTIFKFQFGKTLFSFCSALHGNVLNMTTFLIQACHVILPNMRLF